MHQARPGYILGNYFYGILLRMESFTRGTMNFHARPRQEDGAISVPPIRKSTRIDPLWIGQSLPRGYGKNAPWLLFYNKKWIIFEIYSKKHIFI